MDSSTLIEDGNSLTSNTNYSGEGSVWFELAYLQIAVQYVSHNATETPRSLGYLVLMAYQP